MIYSEQTDDILVGLTLIGDENAYEALVLRYQKAVLASAYSVIQNSYMAEDAAQDAFVSAWMKLSDLRDPSKYGAWVCRIVKNCAKNMFTKIRGHIDLDTILRFEEDTGSASAELSVPDSQDVNTELHDSLERLPKKIQQVIYLHYFEGLSIAEIAERTLVPVGTVKWQLHEGRQMIRKDMDAMNEHENDALVERVMKKVRELLEMARNNDRSGIEAAYRALLPEVESLPDSQKKQHALADVLRIGWWYVKGIQNAEYLARLRDAAERGHNEETIEVVASVEFEDLSGDERIEFIRDHQIPRLEKGGFTTALASSWFWLACEYIQSKKDFEKGLAANERVLELLSPTDVYYANAVAVKKNVERFLESCSELPSHRYIFHCYAEDYTISEDGGLRLDSQPGYGFGDRYDEKNLLRYVFSFTARCDGYLPPHGLALGETYTATDGSTLTYEKEHLTIETPTATFEDCLLFSIRSTEKRRKERIRAYFKEGVGIVRMEYGADDIIVLGSYNVSGSGILPFEVGNRWEYSLIGISDPEEWSYSMEVIGNDGKRASAAGMFHSVKRSYDENDWHEMILQMCREYCLKDSTNGSEHLNDVSHCMERARALASTPAEIVHTNAACDVMQRIMDMDDEFSPDRTMEGIWNFFQILVPTKDDAGNVDMRHFEDDCTYGFEWKEVGKWNDANYALLYNDIYTMLIDTMDGRIWNDSWGIGTTETIEWVKWNSSYCTHLTCTEGGTVTTAAGEFKDCLKLSLDIEGMEGGLSYRGGHREYYIAPGVGIVRVVSPYPHKRELSAVYELTSYTGTGEGYMPLTNGMFRRFDGIGIADNNVGWAEYTICDDRIFCNRAGYHIK